jgi:hypothetical protein
LATFLFIYNAIINLEVFAMPTLRDYVINENDLKDFGLVPKDYLEDSSVGALLNTAFEQLVTRIFDMNPDIDTEQDIYTRLFNESYSEDKLADRQRSFKYAQTLIVFNLLNLDENPISVEVDSVIANRLKLKKVNGFQK